MYSDGNTFYGGANLANSKAYYDEADIVFNEVTSDIPNNRKFQTVKTDITLPTYVSDPENIAADKGSKKVLIKYLSGRFIRKNWKGGN